MASKSIVLIDDDELVRRGLCDWLASLPNITVIGEAEDAASSMNLIAKQRPDLALVDIVLPGVSGLELVRRIQAQYPQVKCMILSGSVDPELVFDGFNSGACGFIPKQVGADELQLAISRVCDQGAWYLSPSVTRAVMEKTLHMRHLLGEMKLPQEDSALNDREREFLKLLCEGNSFVEIAERLDINPRSVERLKEKLQEKLNVQTLADMMRMAIRLGLIKA